MEIRRFQAADTKTALLEVRKAQGADAVILSNREISGGIEIISALNYDEDLYSFLRQPAASGRDSTTDDEPDEQAEARAADAPAATPGASSEAPDDSAVWLKQTLSQLVWDSAQTREPDYAGWLRRLTDSGFHGPTAHALARSLAADGKRPHDEPALAAALESCLLTGPANELTDGGIIALVGPTGAGKTTTIAKIAAAALQRFAPDDIVLINVDNQRIGAGRQLERLANLLGVAVFEAAGYPELDELLGLIAHRRLVLVDTAGNGPADARFDSVLAALSAVDQPLSIWLTLPANGEHEFLRWAQQRASDYRVDGIALTKLDDVALPGAALSAVIEAGIPLEVLSDGPGIPDDLRIAAGSRDWLAARSATPPAEFISATSEDALARLYQGANHASI